MCGICGIVNVDLDRPASGEILSAMCAAIRHRGPDDEGVFIDGNIGIGMRRLSVIDLDGGRQPQHNEDGACHIVFNGEIYNYPELRRACEARGHRFGTQSDTETVLHLYEDRGADCVLPLNGMFAFAIADSRDRSLTLARDRLGIKPLYYADTGACFVFASEIKAILAHPEVPREIDPVALDQYLTCKYVPGPRTIFKGIRKLPPGHTLTYRNGRFQVRPYWKLSFADGPERPGAEVADELLGRLQNAVRMQMLSDVPLGALLSGGLDSSLIVALMSRLSDRPVKTFSIGFEERSYNELDSARLIAERFETDHHERIVRPDVQGIFERVVGCFDEPFGDSSAIPAFLISELAREHVTVALSGTGADELFAGYERYWAIPLSRAYRRVPRPFRNALAFGLRHIPTGHAKRSLALRARRFVESASGDLLPRHRGVVGLFSRADRKRLYAQAWQSDLAGDIPDPLAERFAASDAEADLDRLLDLDTGTLLADDYLVKDDRMSMAVSLELRVPFLDHTLVEFAASLPPHLKLRRLTAKYILKEAARGILPRAILRRPKHGFEIPVARWIGNELRGHVHDLLLSPRSLARGIFSRLFLEQLICTHTSGHDNLSRQIWSLMALEMWHRTYANVTKPESAVSPGC